MPDTQTRTYQLGYGGVPAPHPKKGTVRWGEARHGDHACWRVFVFVDDKGHYEVLCASTKKFIAKAAYDACKDRELRWLVPKKFRD